MAQASFTSEPMAILPDLRDKVVLITGASTRPGPRVGPDGAKVAINYRQSQAEWQRPNPP